MGKADESVILDDTWKFDMIKEQWSFMALTNEIRPEPRYGAIAEFFEDDQTMIVFGGQTDYGPQNDL